MRHRLLCLDEFTEALAGLNLYQVNHEPDLRHQSMIRTLHNVYQGELTHRQKECMYYYHYQNKKMVEIAGMMGINVSTVSRHIHKAQLRLKKVMDYYYPS
ncbi:MAG: hypothetical protein HFE39_04620 [Clostridiales bacterium]|jgi:RNA polymerase sigma factor (sigma-70 family)|nr:hypothetical protein [Clostridiales bacterium]